MRASKAEVQLINLVCKPSEYILLFALLLDFASKASYTNTILILLLLFHARLFFCHNLQILGFFIAITNIYQI